MHYNPYLELKKSAREWVRRAIIRKSVQMWVYPKDKLSNGWSLCELAQRVAAAKQLGYEVVLTYRDEGAEAGLYVHYREKLPDVPWFY